MIKTSSKQGRSDCSSTFCNNDTFGNNLTLTHFVIRIAAVLVAKNCVDRRDDHKCCNLITKCSASFHYQMRNLLTNAATFVTKCIVNTNWRRAAIKVAERPLFF